MADSRLAPVDPSDYRYAVHSCGYKFEVADQPDRAAALFADAEMAKRYGSWMWPGIYEVVDVLTGERLCA